MVPFMLAFAAHRLCSIPDRLLGDEASGSRATALPLLRLGSLDGRRVLRRGRRPGRGHAIAPGADRRRRSPLVGLTFRLDQRPPTTCFRRGALSLSAPIGLALWILALHGMTQTSVNLFLPLLLQVVHGVSPVFDQLPEHRYLVRLDHRHIHCLGLVRDARAGGADDRAGHRV